MPNKRSSFKRTVEEIVKDTKHDFPFAVWPNWTTLEQFPNAFQSVNNHGWLISSAGCLVPVQSYVNSSDLRIVRRSLGLTENPLDTASEVGDTAWPQKLQHSSLCHRHACCNPFHFVIEPQWKNLRRNYCRGKVNREVLVDNRRVIIPLHDCGMNPPCLIRYVNHKELSREIDPYIGALNYDDVCKISLGGGFPKFDGTHDPEEKFAKVFRISAVRKERRKQQKNN